MINEVRLIGNIGNDAEVKKLESGVFVAKFSIATEKRWKNAAGEFESKTEWHRIVLWRDLAERATALKKGMQVYVSGEITYNKYTGTDGIERQQTDIVANAVRILGAKQTEQSEKPKEIEKPKPTPAATTEDLPF